VVRKVSPFPFRTDQLDKREQPQKCKGCEWGNWDGVKQFCPKPKEKCVRENGGDNS